MKTINKLIPYFLIGVIMFGLVGMSWPFEFDGITHELNMKIFWSCMNVGFFLLGGYYFLNDNKSIKEKYNNKIVFLQEQNDRIYSEFEANRRELFLLEAENDLLKNELIQSKESAGAYKSNFNQMRKRYNDLKNANTNDTKMVDLIVNI